MNSKLTLSINKSLTQKAKVYARRQGSSLSNLVESYFKMLTREVDSTDLEVSSRVKSLRGVLKAPKAFDHKKDLADSLSKKYLK